MRADDLPKVFWAYRTTARSTTGETHFHWSTVMKPWSPSNLGAGSLRRDNFDPEQNMILQRRKLDVLEEKRRDSQLRVAVCQRCTAWYFNSKVKTRRFQEGDLVLRRVLHNKGALDPSWEGPYKISRELTPSAYQLAHLNRD